MIEEGQKKMKMSCRISKKSLVYVGELTSIFLLFDKILSTPLQGLHLSPGDYTLQADLVNLS